MGLSGQTCHVRNVENMFSSASDTSEFAQSPLANNSLSSQQQSFDRKKRVKLKYDQATDRLKKHRLSLGSKTLDSHMTRSVAFFRRAGSTWSEGCSVCERLVKSSVFNFVVFVLIFMNAACIGYEVNLQMLQSVEEFDRMSGGQVSSSSRADWLKVSDIILNTFFILELVLRVAAHQGQFCAGQDWKWNLFDALMVCASLLELGLLVSFDLSYIRILRVLRIARSLRMIHLLKFAGLRDLRLMLMAIIASAVPLFWAGLIVMTLMFFFGVIFLNGVAEYTADATVEDPNVHLIKVFFPDLAMTLLTLFMSITGGISWWDVQQVFLNISLTYACVFVFFVLVTVLAALNIITGIFVNDAVEMSRLDAELKVQHEMDQNREYLQHLHELFHQIDTKSHGAITLDDFTEQMEREEVRMLFAMLGLDVSDAVSFFELLDVDGSIDLEIDEFVMGCMRFRGNPSNVNLECSVLEAKQLLVKSLTRQNRMEEGLVILEGLMEGLCASLGFQRAAPSRRKRRGSRSDELRTSSADGTPKSTVKTRIGSFPSDSAESSASLHAVLPPGLAIRL